PFGPAAPPPPFDPAPEPVLEPPLPPLNLKVPMLEGPEPPAPPVALEPARPALAPTCEAANVAPLNQESVPAAPVRVPPAPPFPTWNVTVVTPGLAATKLAIRE